MEKKFRSYSTNFEAFHFKLELFTVYIFKGGTKSTKSASANNVNVVFNLLLYEEMLINILSVWVNLYRILERKFFFQSAPKVTKVPRVGCAIGRKCSEFCKQKILLYVKEQHT